MQISICQRVQRPRDDCCARSADPLRVNPAALAHRHHPPAHPILRLARCHPAPLARHLCLPVCWLTCTHSQRRPTQPSCFVLPPRLPAVDSSLPLAATCTASPTLRQLHTACVRPPSTVHLTTLSPLAYPTTTCNCSPSPPIHTYTILIPPPRPPLPLARHLRSVLTHSSITPRRASNYHSLGPPSPT